MDRPTAPLARASGSATGEPAFAALDLGTNGVRLLIGAPAGDGFRVIEAASRITRLGEGLDGAGLLSEPAIARAEEAVRRLAERIRHHRVVRVEGVATEACRRAGNGLAVVARLSAAAGFPIRPIAAEREAALILAGCRPLFDPPPRRTLILDIGGGSSELILAAADGSAPERVLSLPDGVVTLAERMGEAAESPAAFDALVDGLGARLAGFDADGALRRRAMTGGLQLIGTSGTATTLAAVHLALDRYDRELVDGLRLGFADLRTVTARLLAMDLPARRQLPGVGPDRAGLIMAGCAILEAVCRAFPSGDLLVADRGVRDGLLLAMIAADRAGSAGSPA